MLADFIFENAAICIQILNFLLFNSKTFNLLFMDSILRLVFLLFFLFISTTFTLIPLGLFIGGIVSFLISSISGNSPFFC